MIFLKKKLMFLIFILLIKFYLNNIIYNIIFIFIKIDINYLSHWMININKTLEDLTVIRLCFKQIANQSD